MASRTGTTSHMMAAQIVEDLRAALLAFKGLEAALGKQHVDPEREESTVSRNRRSRRVSAVRHVLPRALRPLRVRRFRHWHTRAPAHSAVSRYGKPPAAGVSHPAKTRAQERLSSHIDAVATAAMSATPGTATRISERERTRGIGRSRNETTRQNVTNRRSNRESHHSATSEESETSGVVRCLTLYVQHPEMQRSASCASDTCK